MARVRKPVFWEEKKPLRRCESVSMHCCFPTRVNSSVGMRQRRVRRASVLGALTLPGLKPPSEEVDES